MSNHAQIGVLSARIGEVSRAIEKLQGELSDLGRQLQRAISEDRSPEVSRSSQASTERGSLPLIRRGGVILSTQASTPSSQPSPERRPRGRAGTMPAMVAKILSENPGRQFKPRELAERLSLNRTQARSLGITLLRLRKEGRIGFNPQGKTYHHGQSPS
jgi:hypothetical protein